MGIRCGGFPGILPNEKPPQEGRGDEREIIGGDRLLHRDQKA